MKRKLPHAELVSVTILLLTALLWTGCKSTETTKTASTQTQEERIGEEYVTVQTTGSLLPRRVKVKDLKKENLTVEGADSPTLQQIEKNQWMQTKPKSN